MTDKDWETLFALIKKATHIPKLSADEKGELIKAKAIENDAESDLEEFVYEIGNNE